jgi:hypothetical protein
LASVKTWKPITGGILSIIAGGIHLIGWLGLSLFLSRASDFFGREIPNSQSSMAWVVTFPLVILAIIAIIGGIFALRRRIWGLALFGAICAIFSPLTWFLGVLAIIFVAIGKSEFNHHISQTPPPTNLG